MWLAFDFQFLFLQHKIDILLYSYSCICLDSILVIRRSVSVDLWKLFNTCFQGGWFFICYPLLQILSELFFLFEVFLFRLVGVVCLCEEKLFLISDIRGGGGHLDRCCLFIFPDFETNLLTDFEIQCGEKISRGVDRASNVCHFEIKLQHIIQAFHSAGGSAFVWTKRASELLSARTTFGFVASHKMCAKSRFAI